MCRKYKVLEDVAFTVKESQPLGHMYIEKIISNAKERMLSAKSTAATINTM